MFCKAERLVLAPNSICPSLGSATAKLLGSKSKQKPHFVTKKANNRCCCDTNYPMWKCAKICSHIITCAYPDKCLCDFLPKITKIPNCGTLFSAGKKPINVRNLQSLWQQHYQVCKKYSCALPILVFWLLRQLNQPFFQHITVLCWYPILCQCHLFASLVLCPLVVLQLQVKLVNLPLKLLSQFQHCWHMYL